MTFQPNEEQIKELQDLETWLQHCPARHRHLLACFSHEFYMELCHLDSAAKNLQLRIQTILMPFESKPEPEEETPEPTYLDHAEMGLRETLAALDTLTPEDHSQLMLALSTRCSNDSAERIIRKALTEMKG